MFEVSKEFEVSAAHFLPGHPTCGKVHGHNYQIVIIFAGLELNEQGMLIDFKDIKYMAEPVLQKLDHGMLNEVADVHGDLIFDDDFPPTAENIARYMHEQIEDHCNFDETRWDLTVQVQEAAGSIATYY